VELPTHFSNRLPTSYPRVPIDFPTKARDAFGKGLGETSFHYCSGMPSFSYTNPSLTGLTTFSLGDSRLAGLDMCPNCSCGDSSQVQSQPSLRPRLKYTTKIRGSACSPWRSKTAAFWDFSSHAFPAEHHTQFKNRLHSCMNMPMFSKISLLLSRMC
jgi:hypothetical protein